MTKLQQAIAKGLAVLSTAAGEAFTYSGVRFVAWPVVNEVELSTGIDQTTASEFSYECKSAPVFKAGAVIVSEDTGLHHSVVRRHPVNPTTGAFRFSVGPGRAVS